VLGPPPELTREQLRTLVAAVHGSSPEAVAALDGGGLKQLLRQLAGLCDRALARPVAVVSPTITPVLQARTGPLAAGCLESPLLTLPSAQVRCGSGWPLRTHTCPGRRHCQPHGNACDHDRPLLSLQ
jgi:hypothetical protein